MNDSLAAMAVILAAGRGTRMKSAMPKVLHSIAGMPMLSHVMQAARAGGCPQLTVVCAPDMPEVAECAKQMDETCQIALQSAQLGTANAVLAAKEIIEAQQAHIMVLFGDSPLVKPDTIETMLRTLTKNPRAAVVVLGFDVPNPPAYGRLITDEHGYLQAIVETRDATPEQLAITRCNGGAMAIRGTLAVDLLERIDNQNAQGEFYLTDIIAKARLAGYDCLIVNGTPEEALGVNSREDQAAVEALMQQRLRKQAMQAGVNLVAPETVYLAADTEFGRDVRVEPHVIFGSGVSIGDGVEIRAFSHLEGCVIGNGAMIGPFARLRPGTNIGEDCKIGNFVETKKAEIERGAKISHLSYIGDAHIGEEANIGAGTITCNYDGYQKYRTEVGRDVFIGSNTALVAPVSIGAGAYVGAGSVITENIEANALSLSRAYQVHKLGWAANFHKMQEQK